MRRPFVLTPQARDDLREILFTVADDSPRTAERLSQEFFRGLQRLGRSPGVGHYREDLANRHYRFWNFYSYLICYRWSTKPIQVVAVVHGRRHLSAFFETRL